jgi:hypothetical protein
MNLEIVAVISCTNSPELPHTVEDLAKDSSKGTISRSDRRAQNLFHRVRLSDEALECRPSSAKTAIEAAPELLA